MPDWTTRLIAKPQLTRKKQVVPVPPSLRVNSAIQIQVPQKAQTKKAPQPHQNPVPQVHGPAPVKSGRHSLRNIIQSAQQNVQAPAQHAKAPSVKPKAPQLSQVVNKKHQPLKKQSKRPGEVKYITPDVQHSDIEAVRNVRGLGAGKILVILGNGPSILEVDDLQMLKGQYNIDTMSINKPVGRLWPTTHWSFFDQSQLRRHRQQWEGYSGTLFNSTSIKDRKPGTIVLKNLGGKGFSRDLTEGFRIGRSSVYASMQIALWLDYAHVYIFGCDMSQVTIDGTPRMHFYGVNPDVEPDIRENRFDAEAEYYNDGASILEPEERARFTFCSTYNQYSFVDKFNRLDHRTAVQAILDRSRRLCDG